MSTVTTTDYFNKYYSNNVSYKVSEVDAVIGFFLKRGFDQAAAINTAIILLEQAALSNLPTLKLIDTLKGVSDVELSNIVAQILNYKRENTSAIGYKLNRKENLFDKRNIIL